MTDGRRNESEPLIGGMESYPEGAFRLPEVSEELRRSLLERTERIVIARRRRPILTAVALVAAAYLFGLATALLVGGDPVPDGGAKDAVSESSATGSGFPTRDGEESVAPAELERRSQKAPAAERTALLVRAGNLYLSSLYDVENALDCYSRALDAMPASEETSLKPGDTWLLAALKDSRR